jgi:hypothetical protein
MEDKRGAYRVLVVSPLGRPKCRWEDIVLDLQEVGWGGMEWFALTQHRDRWRVLVTTVMNLQVPQNAGNFLTAKDLLASQEGLCSLELVSYLVISMVTTVMNKI